MSREAEIRALVTRVIEESLVTHDGEKVAIGCDHGGLEMKMKLIPVIEGLGYTCIDCGCDSIESVDYPDYAHDVARRVGAHECQWGIVIDGAGIGSCMTANKVPGVRAAMCYDISTARNSREHNHANVLSLGAGLIGFGLASQIVESWFATEWGGTRHARRVAKITAIEKNYCGGHRS
jgi:RpiB/LacA/LacB family sugar-phosphate isomerase